MKPVTQARGVVPGGFVVAVLLGLVSVHALAGTAQCQARSAIHRTAVLELYTSEGCNSCPPADHWLSALPARGFGFDQVIPLAFHVDYWDQLGWPDRMAKAEFSARQRAQAERNRARMVYTPQILLDGIDYRIGSDFAQRIDELNRRPAKIELLLRHGQSASGVTLDLKVKFTAASDANARTFLAITENRLESVIIAGENRGKLLHHDFVVRELAGPLPKDANGNVHWNSDMVLHHDWKRADLSLVAFVQNERNGEMLQALQTPLCPLP